MDGTEEYEALADQLAYGLLRAEPSGDRDPDRETCIRFTTSPNGRWCAELVVRGGFVRLNLAEPPSALALAKTRLEAKATTDARWSWAAEVRRDDALGARLLLDEACGLIERTAA